MREVRAPALSCERAMRQPRPYRRALIVTVGIWTALIAVSATAQTIPDLYRFVDGRATPRMFSPTVMGARQIALNADALEAAEAIGLRFLDDARYVARRTQLEQRGPNDLTWRGRLEQTSSGRVVLTLKNDLVMGLIYAPDGIYQLDLLADGGQVLTQLDQSEFPECAGGIEPLVQAGDTHGEDVAPSGDTASRIDVMVVYTPQARDAAGGVAAIEATAQAAVDIANTAFMDSNMVARYNLVHTALANHNDSGDLYTDLPWVANDAGVATLRNTHAADLVSLIVENGGGFCGLGYVMRTPGASFESAAFQVTARTCAVGNLSWAHEHGHNIGMEHDPANGPLPADASYPWSFGHFIDGSYRTVMSYSNQCTLGCTRVAHFSNPSVTHLSAPTGIADARDNHRTGNLTGDIVSNFRQQLCSGTADLVLQNQSVTTTQVYEACDSITAGPSFSIVSPANVTFRAGQSIVLRNGFSVGSGASFAAEIDPSVGSD